MDLGTKDEAPHRPFGSRLGWKKAVGKICDFKIPREQNRP